jgi:thiamine-monophosphate kinase
MAALAGEDRLIAWLRRRARGAGGEGLGDDAALLRGGGGPWALTVDAQIAGVHFPPDLDPRLVARRLLAVNLSDLAAVGAEPRYALLALAAPPGFDHRRFLAAAVASCRRWGVQLAGGDLAQSPLASATLTLVGARPRGGRWVRRSGARPGDRLWLGGTVGESAAGRWLLAAGASLRSNRPELPARFTASEALAAAARQAVRRHLSPRPQLALGRWLGRQRRAAAIDLSDGLSRDLARLCHASGVGATVAAGALPAPPHLLGLAHLLGRDPLELMLAGGEDYVLLFTLPRRAAPPPLAGCREIGEITRETTLRIREQGRVRPLRPAGWDHLRAGGGEIQIEPAPGGAGSG